MNANVADLSGWRFWESSGTGSSLRLAPLVLLAFLTACHSSHVDVTVSNRTGALIKLLEVDYASASFGAAELESGQVYHYRVQLRGSGPVKVQFMAADGRQASVDGPTLSEPQEGSLDITLLPGGKAEFHPQIAPAR